MATIISASKSNVTSIYHSIVEIGPFVMNGLMYKSLNAGEEMVVNEAKKLLGIPSCHMLMLQSREKITKEGKIVKAGKLFDYIFIQDDSPTFVPWKDGKEKYENLPMEAKQLILFRRLFCGGFSQTYFGKLGGKWISIKETFKDRGSDILPRNIKNGLVEEGTPEVIKTMNCSYDVSTKLEIYARGWSAKDSWRSKWIVDSLLSYE